MDALKLQNFNSKRGQQLPQSLYVSRYEICRLSRKKIQPRCAIGLASPEIDKARIPHENSFNLKSSGNEVYYTAWTLSVIVKHLCCKCHWHTPFKLIYLLYNLWSWSTSEVDQVLLRRIVKRFREGLVFKAHILLYHSTLGSRVTKKKRGKLDLAQ